MPRLVTINMETLRAMPTVLVPLRAVVRTPGAFADVRPEYLDPSLTIAGKLAKGRPAPDGSDVVTFLPSSKAGGAYAAVELVAREYTLAPQLDRSYLFAVALRCPCNSPTCTRPVEGGNLIHVHLDPFGKPVGNVLMPGCGICFALPIAVEDTRPLSSLWTE